MTWQVPWVISDVTEIPLEVARVLAYAATDGRAGVVEPGDLEVRALTIPGTFIRVLDGAFSAPNRFGGPGRPESYIGYNLGEDVVAAPANTTGAKIYRMVYAHILDPGQTGGGSVAGPVETRIIACGANDKRLQDVTGYANQSGIALARLEIPALTSTIQQNHIVDLRTKLRDNREKVVKVLNMPNGATENQASGTWNLFPNQATWTVDVPSWATRMSVIGHIDGMEIRGSTGQGWNGKMRIKTGATTYTSPTEINVVVAQGPKDTMGTLVADDLVVPKAERNTTQTFRFEAIKDGGAAGLWAAWGTVMVLDLTFYDSTESVDN